MINIALGFHRKFLSVSGGFQNFAGSAGRQIKIFFERKFVHIHNALSRGCIMCFGIITFLGWLEIAGNHKFLIIRDR